MGCYGIRMECPFCIGVSGGGAGANDLCLFREDGSSFPNGGEIDSRAVASWPLRFRAGPLAPAAEFAARVLGVGLAVWALMGWVAGFVWARGADTPA